MESCVGLEPLAKVILWSSVIGWEQPGKRVGVKAGTDFEEAAAEGGQLTTFLATSSLLKDLSSIFP